MNDATDAALYAYAETLLNNEPVAQNRMPFEMTEWQREVLKSVNRHSDQLKTAMMRINERAAKTQAALYGMAQAININGLRPSTVILDELYDYEQRSDHFLRYYQDPWSSDAHRFIFATVGQALAQRRFLSVLPKNSQRPVLDVYVYRGGLRALKTSYARTSAARALSTHNFQRQLFVGSDGRCITHSPIDRNVSWRRKARLQSHRQRWPKR